jgi:hypothetical protein
VREVRKPEILDIEQGSQFTSSTARSAGILVVCQHLKSACAA